MKLRQFESNWLPELMSWFDNENALTQWGGPNFRYPFDGESFEADLNWRQLASYIITNDNCQLLAFGQYYLRLNRCHLGRLVVAPEARGKGYATMLIQGLIEKGQQELKVKKSSLFVYQHNKSAIKVYQRLGFSVEIYPESMPLENLLYMVR